ncbi:hypothetical protein GYMLUDRAFT_46701 [Collybiopsis luxurians FD-317 M1]|uniref:Uncharacterized protein n=1 Tax=Collybiopsis luxurians FD-317 M1 TaxID=944289 RepID=A0A0D0CG29_9AGAR|nr:hypothetical protein GYMLUDRAFT_46701 [Collybiopsis luxurians FD-317 M1]
MSSRFDVYSIPPIPSAPSSSTSSQPRVMNQPVPSPTAADSTHTHPPSYQSTVESEASDSTRPASANPYEYIAPSFAATSSTSLDEDPAPDHSFRPPIPPAFSSYSTFTNPSRPPTFTSKWPPVSRFVIAVLVLAGNLYTAAQAYNTSTVACVIGLILGFGTFYYNIRPQLRVTTYPPWSSEVFSAMNHASQTVFGAEADEQTADHSDPPSPLTSPSTKPKTKTKGRNGASAADRNSHGAFFASAHSFEVHAGVFNNVTGTVVNNFNASRRRRGGQ